MKIPQRIKDTTLLEWVALCVTSPVWIPIACAGLVTLAVFWALCTAINILDAVVEAGAK